MPWKVYQYEPLPTGHHIRVLTIAPSVSPKIHATLEIVDESAALHISASLTHGGHLGKATRVKHGSNAVDVLSLMTPRSPSSQILMMHCITFDA